MGHLDRFDRSLIRAARRVRAGWHGLGLGLVTGVADDDPSGIATYTVSGSTSGYGLLWTSLATLPLNIAAQSICARIGIVTGRGLTANIARHYGRGWLRVIVLLLFVANVVNIAAGIGAIAAAIALLVPVSALLFVAPNGVGIAFMEIVVPYTVFARYLKMLTFVVFAYVIGAFAARPDWSMALEGTFRPTLTFDRAMLGTLAALLGTTILPYLFFWQTSHSSGRRLRKPRSQQVPGKMPCACWLPRRGCWCVRPTQMLPSGCSWRMLVSTSWC